MFSLRNNVEIRYPFQYWLRSDMSSSRCEFIIPVAIGLTDNIETGIQDVSYTYFMRNMFGLTLGMLFLHAL